MNTKGHHLVDLYKNAKGKRHLDHRLVAIALISNPDGKPMIDHIDENKTNNNISNLRFATHSENNQNKSINKTMKALIF